MSDTGRARSTDPLGDYLGEHGPVSLRLGAAARGRILAATREASRERRSAAASMRRMPALSFAAAGVAVLILTVGIFTRVPPSSQLAVPFVSDEAPGQGRPASRPEGLWIDYEDGQVVLTWEGTAAAPRAVKEASSIPAARTAHAVQVRGGAFVESEVPALGEAVFYVVE